MFIMAWCLCGCGRCGRNGYDGMMETGGLTTAGMILVNSSSAGSVFPFLVHAQIGGGITFADTIYPTFLFTSGLSSASSSPVSSSASLKKALKRSLLLVGLGLANNALSLLPPSPSRSVLRLPGVLQRTSISTLIASLLPLAWAPPVLLGGWYLLTRGEGGHTLRSHAVVDSAVFPKERLYLPLRGFDPEGVVGTLTTAPLTVWFGKLFSRFLSSPSMSQGTEGEVFMRLASLALLLIGPTTTLVGTVTRSFLSKELWTPSFVTFNAGISIFYYLFSSVLLKHHLLPRPVENAMVLLGRYSLEAYLVSQALITLGRKTGLMAYAVEKLAGLMDRKLAGLVVSVGVVAGTWGVVRELRRRGWKIRA
ncbi:hypothetical protein BT69DRAFT_1349166 [Atractiella rhizophila]|nr:hypothetical protein BT69DRAFT_1349166 [Atractiella rhizophila]